MRLALAGTRDEDTGAASGALLTVIQASNAAGVAAVGALFAALLDGGRPYPAAFATSLAVLCAMFGAASGVLMTFRRE